MKSKKILIVYLKQRFESVTALQTMYQKLMRQMTNEGYVVSKVHRDTETNITCVSFEDGTIIEVIPFGKKLIGKRFNEIYIEEKIMNLTNGSHFVSEMLLPLAVYEEHYTNVKTFSVDENGLNIKKYK